MQLIIHTLWGLNRALHSGLFVVLTPIVGDPLFEELIVMALFVELWIRE